MIDYKPDWQPPHTESKAMWLACGLAVWLFLDALFKHF